jgi:hypothetical protein
MMNDGIEVKIIHQSTCIGSLITTLDAIIITLPIPILCANLKIRPNPHQTGFLS